MTVRSVVRRLAKTVLALVGVAAFVVAGLVGLVWYQGQRIQTGPAAYVAMGSSFASGPGITERAEGSPILCGRSKDNYPHLLAEKLGMPLIDVSCGGAVTEHILTGGQFFQRAQIDAVKPETELVTITIGGNNIGYMANLFAAGCRHAPGAVPRMMRGRICDGMAPAKQAERFAELEGSMAAVITETRKRAPNARIILLTYQTVLPPAGTCPALVLNQAEADEARRVAKRLYDMTVRVAQANSAILFDAATLTRDHGVCAAQPWLEGFVFPDSPIGNGPMAFHTNLAGMQAIADGLATALVMR